MSRGITTEDFSTTIHPGENFYQYVNEGWLARNPIPDDEFRWSGFSEVYKRNEKRLHTILEQLGGQDAPSDANAQKLRDLYRTGMDEVRLEEQGYEPIRSYLDLIDQVSDRHALLDVLAELHISGVNAFWDASVTADDKQSDVNIFRLHQAGLGLPDREYYFKQDASSLNLIEQYKQHIGRMFALIEYTDTGAAEIVFGIEKQLAESSMNSEQLRDHEKQYHKYTFAQLQHEVPNIDLVRYCKQIQVGPLTELIVNQPLFMKTVNSLLSDNTIAAIKLYLKWRLLSATSGMLSNAFVAERFAFYGRILTGAKELQPRWRRVLRCIDQGMGEALGKEFVARYFTPEAKSRMDELVKFLIIAFQKRIDKLTWMSETTKRKARLKLEAMTWQIGYPDVWRDYTALQINTESYATNCLALNRFEFQRTMAKLGTPVDKSEWYMSPPTVNAYNAFWYNQIVFPAGILQPHFFDVDADDAVNYGAIGAVIGHELTHGFDDQGSKYDESGSMQNWWTDSDRELFEQKANQIVKQFNAYSVADDLSVNGTLTLGENIADLGGLVIAFDALQEALVQRGRPELIDGLTPEQRFFIAWAQVWRENITAEALRKQVLTDPHAPEVWRTNGPLTNIDAFYKAFDIQPSNRLYSPPEERIVIW